MLIIARLSLDERSFMKPVFIILIALTVLLASGFYYSQTQMDGGRFHFGRDVRGSGFSSSVFLDY